MWGLRRPGRNVGLPSPRGAAELVLEDGDGQRLPADRRSSILDILHRAGIAHPSYCRIGNCGTCAMQIVAGEVKSLTDPSYVLDRAELAAGVFLPCQSRIASDVLVVRRIQRTARDRAPESENAP